MDRMQAPFTPEETLAFVAAARSLKGIKFRHQGRTIRGMDCIGVLVISVLMIGRTPHGDRIDYGKLPAARKLSAVLELNFGAPVARTNVSMESLRVGDIVAMDWGDEPAHVAIVVDHPEGLGLVHAYLDARMVIEQRIDENIRRNITEVYRP